MSEKPKPKTSAAEAQLRAILGDLMAIPDEEPPSSTEKSWYVYATDDEIMERYTVFAAFLAAVKSGVDVRKAGSAYTKKVKILREKMTERLARG